MIKFCIFFQVIWIQYQSQLKSQKSVARMALEGKSWSFWQQNPRHLQGQKDFAFNRLTV